jgi:pimeloyl-ACP methyl ester carboxylesterase
MPYAENQNIRIHYQIEGQGPPLILLHGFCGSIQDFYELGYVAALKDSYQLILVDSRGHGVSDKPHDSQVYRMELRVGDIAAVLDAIGIKKAHYMGYSMGGWIGFGIMKYAPDRFYSLIIGGAQPYERARVEPHPWLEIFEQGIDAAAEFYVNMAGPRLSSERKERMLRNDPDAAMAILTNVERVGVVDILPDVTLPCMLFAGEDSPEFVNAKKCAQILPNAVFIPLPGLDHVGTFWESEYVLPHIRGFLDAQIMFK